MGGRGASGSAKNYKVPTSYRGPGEFGEAFEYAAKKRGMADAEIQRQIRKNLKKPLSVEIPF